MIEIKDHKVAFARDVPTKKHGSTITPRFIVLHYTAGWTTEGDIDTLARSSRQASAHGVLSREGVWTQIVPFNKRAWHAGPSRSHGYTDINQHSIGIEISNAGWVQRISEGVYKDQYGNRISEDGHFLSSKRTTHTPISTWEEHGHPRLARGTYRWEPFYPQQLDYLDELILVLLKRYPTIDHIVSHEEIDTRGWKTDPGPVFPMRRYTKLVENRNLDASEDDDLMVSANTSDVPPASPPPTTPTHVVTATALNVRHEPGGERVGLLHHGDTVAQLGASGNESVWVKIRVTRTNVVGWVAKRYLQEIKQHIGAAVG